MYPSLPVPIYLSKYFVDRRLWSAVIVLSVGTQVTNPRIPHPPHVPRQTAPRRSTSQHPLLTSKHTPFFSSFFCSLIAATSTSPPALDISQTFAPVVPAYKLHDPSPSLSLLRRCPTFPIPHRIVSHRIATHRTTSYCTAPHRITKIRRISVSQYTFRKARHATMTRPRRSSAASEESNGTAGEQVRYRLEHRTHGDGRLLVLLTPCAGAG